jgi:sporulation protein YlmC with PRC-barrel domain
MKLKLRRSMASSQNPWVFAMALVVAGASPGFAAAAASDTDRAVVTKVQAATDGRDVRVTQLMGKDVRNSKNEDLGDINDLVIDLDTGRVQYVVLSFGGFLGMGDKLFAYPLSAFRISGVRDELVLNVDQARLKNAEGFEKSRWPNWNDPAFRGKVARWYDPKAPVITTGRYKRASEIMGSDVRDTNGKDIGDVREVVVNTRDGAVRYAVIEFERGWFTADKYVVVPIQSLKRTGDKDEFIVTRSRAELEKAPAFEKNKWPDINDARYRSTVDQYNKGYQKP